MRHHHIFTLANGIRVVHNPVTSSKIVHCGIMLDIGSRDETPENQGIAHFWEHMAFKGTRKRKAYHILNRLESLGGELNAFTDKEKILFYASLRDDYFERAIELLTDITFQSVFPAGQIARERKVILEEMSMYHDDPDDSLQDEFDAVVFKGHSLGMNVLGAPHTVKHFQRKDFRSFIDRHLDTRRTVFSVVGNLAPDRVVALAEKYLGVIPRTTSRVRRAPFVSYTPSRVELQRPVKQARCAMGRTAFPTTHPRRIPFFMLINLLGGGGMNSRLNLALREKHGFVYTIGAQFVPFTDTGLLVINFGTEPTQLDRSLELVKQELRKLKETKLGTRQLSSAKEQLLGQIAMAEENNIGFMMMMARSLLDQNRITPLEEIFERIEQITAAELQQLAIDMFDEKAMSTLMMVPTQS